MNDLEAMGSRAFQFDRESVLAYFRPAVLESSDTGRTHLTPAVMCVSEGFARLPLVIIFACLGMLEEPPPDVRVDAALEGTSIYKQLMFVRQKLQPGIELYVTPSWLSASGQEWIDDAWDWAEQQKAGPFLFTTAHQLARGELRLQHDLLSKRNRSKTKKAFREVYGDSVQWDGSERRAVIVASESILSGL